MQIDDCKNLLTQSKDHIDTTTQTDVFERNDKSCQTDTSNRNDFQVQAFRGQKEPVSTQTDISPKCDFQVQVNISPANDSKAVQTIKEEIDMPNIPSSTAQTPAKKRKLSSSIRQQSEPITTQTDSSPKCDFQVQANIPPINVSKAVQTIPGEIAVSSIPTKNGQKPAGSPNQIVKQRQAIPSQRNTRPEQVRDVKERFIFIHHNRIILPEMAIFDLL